MLFLPQAGGIKLDKQGRLVFPKEIRDKYHLLPNSDLILIDQTDGSLILKPKPAKKSLKDIFSRSSASNLSKAIPRDYANYHEHEL